MFWLEPLKVAIGLYNSGDDTGCIARADSMLTDVLPHCPRVQCNILLACTVDD